MDFEDVNDDEVDGEIWEEGETEIWTEKHKKKNDNHQNNGVGWGNQIQVKKWVQEEDKKASGGKPPLCKISWKFLIEASKFQWFWVKQSSVKLRFKFVKSITFLINSFFSSSLIYIFFSPPQKKSLRVSERVW